MYKQIPNILTASRLLFAAGFLILMAMADLTAPQAIDRTRMFWSFVLFLIAGLTDIIDGPLARHWSVTSAFGRWFDPLVDKILVGGGFILLAWIGKPTTGIAWWMVGLILAREALVTWVRGLCEANGVAFGAVWTGKLKMFLQSFTIGTIMVQTTWLPEARWAWLLRECCIWITILFTLWSAVAYLLRYTQLTRSTEKPGPPASR